MGSPISTLQQQGTIYNNQATDRQAVIDQNKQLQNVATNGSPLANAQMQQATNQNIAASTGVIASAKGINPAMAARTAAYNQATEGQQSVNQAQQINAQTELGAQSQLSNNLNNMYNTESGTSNQTTALNYQQNQYDAGLAMQYAKMVSSAVGAGMMGGANGGMVPKMAGGGMPGMGGGDDVNTAVQKTLTNHSADQIVADTSKTLAPLQEQNPYSAISSFFNSLDEKGGNGPNSQTGQMMQADDNGLSSVNQPVSGRQSFRNMLNGEDDNASDNPESSMNPDEASDNSSMNPDEASVGEGLTGFARGGRVKKVAALVSPGEVYLKPGQAKAVAKGKANPLKVGERIPGTPKVAGNSYTNDTVAKKLMPKGVIIPNSVMQSSDPAGNAYKFVQAVMAHQKAKVKKK